MRWVHGLCECQTTSSTELFVVKKAEWCPVKVFPPLPLWDWFCCEAIKKENPAAVLCDAFQIDIYLQQEASPFCVANLLQVRIELATEDPLCCQNRLCRAVGKSKMSAKLRDEDSPCYFLPRPDLVEPFLFPPFRLLFQCAHFWLELFEALVREKIALSHRLTRCFCRNRGVPFKCTGLVVAFRPVYAVRCPSVEPCSIQTKQWEIDKDS